MVWASFICWSPFVADLASVVVTGAAQVGMRQARRRRGGALQGLSVEAALEDEAHRAVGGPAGRQRPRAGRLEARGAVALAEAQHPEAAAVAERGVRAARHDGGGQRCRRRARLRRPGLDALRRPGGLRAARMWAASVVARPLRLLRTCSATRWPSW